MIASARLVILRHYYALAWAAEEARQRRELHRRICTVRSHRARVFILALLIAYHFTLACWEASDGDA